MKKIFLVLLIIFIFSGCDNVGHLPDESIDYTSFRDVDGDIDVLLLGQSNANTELAEIIEAVTGRRTGQINHSAQPIETWLSGPCWLSMDIAYLKGRNPDYIVWFQGESNHTEFAEYENKLKEVLAPLSSPHTKIIIIQVFALPGEPYTTDQIRDVQRLMCENNPGWTLVDSAGYSRGDFVHLDTNGKYQLSSKLKHIFEGGIQ